MERVLTHIVHVLSDSDHGSGYYGYRTLGLAPAGTICHSTRSLGHYPIHINLLFIIQLSVFNS